MHLPIQFFDTRGYNFGIKSIFTLVTDLDVIEQFKVWSRSSNIFFSLNENNRHCFVRHVIILSTIKPHTVVKKIKIKVRTLGHLKLLKNKSKYYLICITHNNQRPVFEFVCYFVT